MSALAVAIALELGVGFSVGVVNGRVSVSLHIGVIAMLVIDDVAIALALLLSALVLG